MNNCTLVIYIVISIVCISNIINNQGNKEFQCSKDWVLIKKNIKYNKSVVKPFSF